MTYKIIAFAGEGKRLAVNCTSTTNKEIADKTEEYLKNQGFFVIRREDKAA